MDDDDPKKRAAYDVGYGKPPEHTRWKPKQSGNLRGRPKGATSNKKRSKRMLEALNQVRVGDEVRTITTHDLALERVREGVRKADSRAINQALALARELDRDAEAKAAAAPAGQQESEPMSEDDEAIALEYLLRQKALKEAF